jgi:hypothetical protein
MIEWLFCPIHGIFGTQNLMLMAAYGSSVFVEAQLWLFRVRTLIGGYL